MDIFAFLSSSLDKLAKNRKQSGNKNLSISTRNSQKIISFCQKDIFNDHGSLYSVFSEKFLPLSPT